MAHVQVAGTGARAVALSAVALQRARVRLVAELGGAKRASDPFATRARLLARWPALAAAAARGGGEGWRWLTRTRFHALPAAEEGLFARW